MNLTLNTDRIIRRTVLDQIECRHSQFIKGGEMHAQITTPEGNIAYINFLNLTQPIKQLDTQYNELPADCYGATLSFDEAVTAVKAERHYQTQKWHDQPQSLAGFLLTLQTTINKAIDSWMHGSSSNRHSPLGEVVQVAATAIACIERYGDVGCTINTNDIPPNYPR